MKNTLTKIMSLVLALVMILSCAACGNKETTQDASLGGDTSIYSEKDDYNISDFLKQPAEGNEVESYRAEVSRRLKVIEKDENAKFVTESEKVFLETNGFDLSVRGIEMAEYSDSYMELSIYSYPIVYVGDNNSIQVWSIDKYGSLYAQAIEGKISEYHSSKYFGNVHCTDEEDSREIIKNENGFAVVHDEEKDVVEFWSLGELLCKHELPNDSIYTGFSDWVGYIFRAGTDVYALADIGTINANHKEMCTIKPIAHNVQMVIDADYYMGSDDWAQPLFLMTDGTVKGYCEWVGDEGAPSDHPSYLYDIRHEGGYDK